MPSNHLGENAYRIPASFSTTMNKKDLHDTLLATDGWILACGYLWDIQSQHIGAGVYKVSLAKRGG